MEFCQSEKVGTLVQKQILLHVVGFECSHHLIIYPHH